MRVALITGATKGIGRATAFALAREGYALAFCSRTPADLEETANALEEEFEKIDLFYRKADLSDKKENLSFGEAVLDRFGGVDVLVNNAGLFEPDTVLGAEEGNLEKYMNINLYSAYWLTRQIVPSMVKRGSGHIFNLCSVAALKAYPNGASYCISKHALAGFSRSLREETKDKGIKVTGLFPGATWSASWEGADFPDDRLMQPEDIASCIVAALRLGKSAVVEDLVIRPQLGDV